MTEPDIGLDIGEGLDDLRPLAVLVGTWLIAAIEELPAVRASYEVGGGLCMPVAQLGVAAARKLGIEAELVGGEVLRDGRCFYARRGHYWVELPEGVLLDAPSPATICLRTRAQREPLKYVRHERRNGLGASMVRARRLADQVLELLDVGAGPPGAPGWTAIRRTKLEHASTAPVERVGAPGAWIWASGSPSPVLDAPGTDWRGIWRGCPEVRLLGQLVAERGHQALGRLRGLKPAAPFGLAEGKCAPDRRRSGQSLHSSSTSGSIPRRRSFASIRSSSRWRKASIASCSSSSAATAPLLLSTAVNSSPADLSGAGKRLLYTTAFQRAP
jgi:hypothetical protein